MLQSPGEVDSRGFVSSGFWGGRDAVYWISPNLQASAPKDFFDWQADALITHSHCSADVKHLVGSHLDVAAPVEFVPPL